MQQLTINHIKTQIVSKIATTFLFLIILGTQRTWTWREPSLRIQTINYLHSLTLTRLYKNTEEAWWVTAWTECPNRPLSSNYSNSRSSSNCSSKINLSMELEAILCRASSTNSNNNKFPKDITAAKSSITTTENKDDHPKNAITHY
jgi:hypothetical protein